MDDFGMPGALKIEESRRESLPAIRREVVHNTTTQNEYRPSELCYIPIDTGAAGAFMDVSTTRLELTVVVRNKNYFIDFINLPRCGWHSLIQEFGIEINNGIHELNRHYAECVELEMIRMGENRTPFEITRSNPWRPADGKAGKLHINFIKPSMVTTQGLPHNVSYPSLTTLTSATTPDTITQSLLLFSNPFLTQSLGRNYNGSITTTPDQGIPQTAGIGESSWFTPSSFAIAQSYYDDRISSFTEAKTSNMIVDVTNDPTNTSSYNTGNPALINDIPDSVGPDINVSSEYRLQGLPHGGSLLARYSKMNPGNLSTNGENVCNIYAVSYGQSVESFPPSMWPAKQPCPLDILQKEVENSYLHVNADNIMNYYANCKNIPVGIPLLLSSQMRGKPEIWGDSVHTKPAIENPSVGSETEFHISLKLYSSLIGELAKKWFPELVVPQGRMRVRIRFQEPQIVFQTLMDPCRRVPGTSRDWFPNLGVISTNGAGVGVISGIPPKYITSGVHPIMVSDYIAGDVYVDSIALGQYVLPQMRSKALHGIFGQYDLGHFQGLTPAEDNTNFNKTAGGVDSTRYTLDHLAGVLSKTRTGSLGKFLNTTGSGYSGKQAALALALYDHENRYNQEYGYPIFYQSPANATQHPPLTVAGILQASYKPTTIAQCYNYTHPQEWRTRVLNQDTPSSTNAKIALTSYDTAASPIMGTDPNWDWGYKSLNWNPFCFPTPQYLPISSPSDKTSYRVLDPTVFVDESQTCFGTYRESSVAQVRRTHTQLYPLNIPDTITSRVDERLTYIIKNVQIVTQQIILPRTSALSIVENALNGGISMETRAWKEMESMLPRQETQKHLINMAAGFCTDIAFVFRPIDVFQGDKAYGYNSFSFYNPFTSFQFAFNQQLTPGVSSELAYNSLGGQPIYYNECIIQQRTGFDIQLQLSSELLPRTPIDTIRRLIQHIRWGDQVFSGRDYLQLDPHLHPSYSTQKGMVINTLQDGFWACYTPISALDDQTITDNPFFNPTEISLRKKLRGQRAPLNALPFYKPFDGTFHLSFNLEAFMGQGERMRTGVPIVNNNMFLKFDKAHMIRDFDTQCLTIAQCDARVVFERGGTMQFFT